MKIKYKENLLEETVKVLEIKANIDRIDTKTTETQTDFPKLEDARPQVYFCGDCDYLADCMHDFNDHTHSPDDLENLDKSLFTCNFCEESYQTLQEVMKHNKIKHTSSVQHCKQFLQNVCFYGDNCWFLHSESLRKSEPRFKCNFCDEKSRTHNLLREHINSDQVNVGFYTRKMLKMHIKTQKIKIKEILMI